MLIHFSCICPIRCNYCYRSLQKLCFQKSDLPKNKAFPDLPGHIIRQKGHSFGVAFSPSSSRKTKRHLEHGIDFCKNRYGIATPPLALRHSEPTGPIVPKPIGITDPLDLLGLPFLMEELQSRKNSGLCDQYSQVPFPGLITLNGENL